MQTQCPSPIADIIKAAGGKVHSDGNIFFTNSEIFEAAARAAHANTAGPRIERTPSAWPRNAKEVREFIGSNCMCVAYPFPDEPCDDDLYELTAHDFLSAVDRWADFPHHMAPVVAGEVAEPGQRQAPLIALPVLDMMTGELPEIHASISREIEHLSTDVSKVGAGAGLSELAQLRHLYSNLINGGVQDTASAKRIAIGLLAPVIEMLEKATIATQAPQCSQCKKSYCKQVDGVGCPKCAPGVLVDEVEFQKSILAPQPVEPAVSQGQTDLLRASLELCVEDSEELVNQYVQAYGEKYRPERLAYMRKVVADARHALAQPQEAELTKLRSAYAGACDRIAQLLAVSQDALTQAAKDVLAERQRQIDVEGWTPVHDDKKHLPGEMALAAASYVCAEEDDAPPAIWPWDWKWWKPTGRRRNLVKAGALILAEIECIDRAARAQEGK